MPLKRIVRLDTGVISSKSYKDVWYAPETNLVIKKIVAVEAGGNSLDQVYTTLYIGDVPYFFPDASLALFTSTSLHNPELNLTLPAGVKLTMRVSNDYETERRVLIHLICE